MKLFWENLRLINAKGDRVLKNKDAVISEILTTEYAMFYRIAFSYIHSEADAQDILQESAYKAIYHAKKSFVRWKNACKRMGCLCLSLRQAL